MESESGGERGGNGAYCIVPVRGEDVTETQSILIKQRDSVSILGDVIGDTCARVRAFDEASLIVSYCMSAITERVSRVPTDKWLLSCFCWHSERHGRAVEAELRKKSLRR